MDLTDTPDEAAYRARARAWLAEHRDEAPRLRGPGALTGEDEIIAARRAWQSKLVDGGLAGVTWPVEHGGQGLGPVEQVIAAQEIEHAEVPPVLDFMGLGALGPTVIVHGTPAQQARHLGPLLHGDEVWCQMFSEPGAGSDLAAVQTRAVQREDGGWRLNGQKVWTSFAHFASFGMLLARTDPDVPKHKGLTMFIVPMDAPGLSTSRRRQIHGDAEFSEIFLDDVDLSADAVLGGVGNGWRTALTTLMFERMTVGMSSESYGYRLDRYVDAIVASDEARLDREVRHRLGAIAGDVLAIEYTGYRALTEMKRGREPGPESALTKITMVEAYVRAGELLVDTFGPGILTDDEWSRGISYLPGLKSGGGTPEVLRNMVAERVLGLPPEPRLDKDIPFSELRTLQATR